MNTLIMKFGGASVAAPEHFCQIAEIILHRCMEYRRVVVVVSAMGSTTDHLISLANQVNETPPRREYDMLVSVGERISISLLAMALAKKNREAISFTGSQSGIITTETHSDARILEVRPHRLISSLNMGKIVIVAGFQGVSRQGEITTLGRGGSDTSAVALGVAFGAKVEFYKDIAGIYSEDPKKNTEAVLFPRLNYQEALNIANGGAKVLHPRSIALASKNCIHLHVRSFKSFNSLDTGTIIMNESCLAPQVPLYEDE